MKCLCCNKEMNEINEYKWHKSCLKKFFGITKLPDIDIESNNTILNQIGEKLIANNNSITGVQKKLSLHLSKEKSRFTIIDYPKDYILKFETDEYPCIARCENLVMTMADIVGIKTAMHGLIILKDNTYAYITKRLDRINDKKIHMEDFCQLSERPTEYKYNSSYERCAKIIDKYSSIPKLDKIELFSRIIFCFITGNSDMHLKNFSLMENDNRNYLSKAYDLLPVNILINDLDETALTINGKNRNLHKNDFLAFSKLIEIDEKIAIKIIERLISNKKLFEEMIKESLLTDELKKRFIDLINERIERLSKKNI